LAEASQAKVGTPGGGAYHGRGIINPDSEIVVAEYVGIVLLKWVQGGAVRGWCVYFVFLVAE
jgi:hypothetical protein